MMKKEKPIPSTVCCQQCGHAAFKQTELRKIMVNIIEGEALWHAGQKSTSHALYHCARCGQHLPGELAKRIKFRSQYYEDWN